MSLVSLELVRALRKQLELRETFLRTGARRVGWKLGLSDRDRLDGAIGVGHLTTATCLSSGESYAAEGARELSADAEITVELASDIELGDDISAIRDAIGGYSIALEICDIAPLENEPYAVIATNDFHRAVAFGETSKSPPTGVRAELSVNGHLRQGGIAPGDREICGRLRAAAGVLAAVDERLLAGDRIITSGVVSTPIQPGDDVTARAESLGSIQLQIT